MALDFDNVTAIARKKYIPIMADNILESSWLWMKLKEQESDLLDGGEQIHMPLLYAKNTASGGYAGTDLIDITPQDEFTAAVFPWRHRYASITITQEDELRVSGQDIAILNLTEELIKAAEGTMAQDLGDDSFNDNSDTKVPHGLRHIAQVDRSLGGIDSTTETWWDAQTSIDTTNHTAANMTDPSSNYYLLKLWRSLWNSCSHLRKHPTFIVCSDGMFGVYEEIAEGTLMTESPPSADVKKAADMGFTVMNYKTVPVILDDLCPGGFAFFVNTEFLRLKIHKDNNFKLGQFLKPVNGMYHTAQISLSCNIVCNAPRFQGRHEAATAVS